VDVRFSPEQEALHDSAVQIVDRLGVPTVADLGDGERTGKLDAAVDASGWRELRTSGEGGGPWASAVEVAIVAEELGRGLADVAFVGPILATELRRLSGTTAATGHETVMLRPDFSQPARATQGKVEEGAVAIDTMGATSALSLLAQTDGYAIGEMPLAGLTKSVDLTRLEASSPLSAVTPVAGQTRFLDQDDIVAWQSLGLAVTCADLVGTMRGALTLACEYARERRQYGAAIGSFQAVQHLLADAFVAMEGSRSVALHAAWAVDALPRAEALAAASAAKAYCARAARSVCETAIQVHGGVGNTWDCLAHVFLRRAIVSTDLFGGVGPNLARVLAARGVEVTDGFR
jgi:alkylation response protein AidB-like acyl-CoA dehydrogenase